MFKCKKKPGGTEVVFEINWIQCQFSAILKRHCCHNRRNTLYIDSTLCLESHSIHNFSFILLPNIHRHFLRLEFAFSHFQETVGSHLKLPSWKSFHIHVIVIVCPNTEKYVEKKRRSRVFV